MCGVLLTAAPTQGELVLADVIHCSAPFSGFAASFIGCLAATEPLPGEDCRDASRKQSPFGRFTPLAQPPLFVCPLHPVYWMMVPIVFEKFRRDLDEPIRSVFAVGGNNNPRQIFRFVFVVPTLVPFLLVVLGIISGKRSSKSAVSLLCPGCPDLSVTACMEQRVAFVCAWEKTITELVYSTPSFGDSLILRSRRTKPEE